MSQEFQVGDIVRVNSSDAYRYSSVNSLSEVEVTALVGDRKFRGTILSTSPGRQYSVGQNFEFVSNRFYVHRKGAMNNDIPLADRRVITNKGKMMRMSTVDKIDDLLAELHKTHQDASFVIWKPEFESYVEAPPVKRREI